MAGNAPGQTDTIFPSDGRDIKAAGGAESLSEVCPDRIDDGLACRVCPGCTFFGGLEDSFFRNLAWSLKAVTRGHFLSPTSQDVVLSMDGCEGHEEGYGGTILLTRRSQRWEMLWYKAGVITSKCHKVSMRDGRETLVCMDGYQFHGSACCGGFTILYTEDLLNPTGHAGMEGALGSFFVIGYDDPYSSQSSPSIGDTFSLGGFEKIEFGRNTGGGPPPISLTATFAKGIWTAAANKVREAHSGDFEKFLPPLKRYRIDFIFNGQDYEPAPASAATARIFADQ